MKYTPKLLEAIQRRQETKALPVTAPIEPLNNANSPEHQAARNAAMQGNNMVWLPADAQGNQQYYDASGILNANQYYENPATGERQEIFRHAYGEGNAGPGSSYQLNPQPSSPYQTQVQPASAFLKGGGLPPVGNKVMANDNQGSNPSPPSSSGGGASNPATLGYSSQFSPLLQALDRQQAMLAQQGQQQINDIEVGTQRDLSQAERLQETARRRLQERMADQGILRSGANINAQADLGMEYQQLLDQINTGRATGLRDVNINSQNAMADIAFQRESMAGQIANEQAQQAREDAQRRAQAEAAAEEVRRRTEAAQPRPSATGQYISPLQNYDARTIREQGVMNMFAGLGLDPSHHLSGAYEDPIARIQRIAGGEESLDSIRRRLTNMLR